MLALAVLALAVPAAGAPREAGRGVLVVSIDSLRADHFSGAGYDRPTTPVLDALAAEGVSFSQAFSTGPWLLPAHVSVLTGCDPFIALRYLPENIPPSLVTLWHIPDGAPRLAKEFLRHGYATAAFSDHPWLGPVHGFEPGFEKFSACVLKPGTRTTDIGIEGVGSRLELWLRSRPRDEDWFAYVHLHDLWRTWNESDPLWDTHFRPRPELEVVPPVSDAEHAFHAVPRRRWPGGLHTIGDYEAQYDGALRHLDGALGRLFSRIRQMGRWEQTTVAVLGTYGIGFGEEWILLDHGTLTDIDLSVPLILRPRRGSEFVAGLRTSALASLMDVGPTLLELDGIDVPIEMHGVSQAAALRGAASPREFAVARCGFQAGFAVMDDRWCFEHTLPWAVRDPELARSWYGREDLEDLEPREVLHDRRAGPRARHSGATAFDAEVAARLRQAGSDWVARVNRDRRTLQAVTWPTPPDPQHAPVETLPQGGSPGSPP